MDREEIELLKLGSFTKYLYATLQHIDLVWLVAWTWETFIRINAIVTCWDVIMDMGPPKHGVMSAMAAVYLQNSTVSN